MSRRGRQGGFTLIEVLFALGIVAAAVTTLMVTSNRALKSSVETNRLRAAQTLLRLKAEEVALGLELGSGGGFEGHPGFTWEVYEQLVPLEDAEEEVLSVTVAVRYPTLRGERDPRDQLDPWETRDAPGELRVTMLLDPHEAELQPLPQQGGPGGGLPGAGGGEW